MGTILGIKRKNAGSRIQNKAPSDSTAANLARRPAAEIIKLDSNASRVELLAAQPISLAGLSQAERNRVVVTAVIDEDGVEHPVCRFGDPVWDLTPETEVKNKRRGQLSIEWPSDVPASMVHDVKAALYCALRRGRDGGKWSGSAIAGCGKVAIPTMRELVRMGLTDFSQVRALHLSDHIATLRKKIQPSSVRRRLEILDVIWFFAMEVFHPLPEHPWAGETLGTACGQNEAGGGPASRTGKTLVIPRAVQRAIFEICEARLDKADELLRARDAGEITSYSYELTSVRDAVLYLVQITSGMRNSESTGIRNGCWRTEVKNGVQLHWVRTREIKTSQGEVEFLVPREALSALELLQRYAAPLQERLASEAGWLEELLTKRSSDSELLANGMSVVEAIQRLNHVREIGQHLFLGIHKGISDHLGTDSRIEVMSLGACNYQLKALARAAGSDWKLANHQCRRTFAYNVANSRLGRMGLVFLKWQLKHASVSWTQLYASNPYQDLALYRELQDEAIEARTHLIEGWLRPDSPLSGGAGKRLMQTRAVPVRGRTELLRSTAEAVLLRSTGHAWCLSGARGCDGQGVHEPVMCGACSQGVIDADFSETWQMIHLDNLSLGAVADCGPAVVQKAQRAIQRSAEVLKELGVALPSMAQAEKYEGLYANGL